MYCLYVLHFRKPALSYSVILYGIVCFFCCSAQPQQHQLSAYSAVVAPFDHQLALSDIEDIEQQNKTDVTIIKATDTEPRIARHSIVSPTNV